ncbi:MAG: hypothetical protein JWM33_910, partial [Caulobacteraceae bacterium]|nr:hypothetical protein [Caulobacteraceae bacterium]
AQAVRAALSPLVLVYGVGEAARSAAFWGVYVETLSGLPAEALRAAAADYAAGAGAEFFPKPGPLKALALKHAEPLRRAAARAARVGEGAVAVCKPPVEARRKQVEALLASFPSPNGEGRRQSRQGGECPRAPSSGEAGRGAARGTPPPGTLRVPPSPLGEGSL